MKKIILVGVLLGSFLLALQAKPTPIQSSSSLQFMANRHILLFKDKSITVASTSHAMTIKFVNARNVLPKVDFLSLSPSVPEVPNMPGSMPGMKDKIPTLGTVTYANLWKGVTLEYANSTQGIYESTYRLLPDKKGRVHAERVRLAYNRDLTLDKNGNLIIHYPNGTLTESAPVAWQDIDGKRMPVPVAYKLRGRNYVGFTLGAYRAGIPVTIDPTLSWNTFLGGSGDDFCVGVATDISGNVYVAGHSTATWGSPIQGYSGGYYDGFVAKLTSAGVLSWNTFLGGNGTDLCGGGITTDASGNVYVVGMSTATWGSPIRAYSGSDAGFVAKLTSAGALSWNTFLGGSGAGVCYGITTDAFGNLYVAGASTATWGTPIRAFSNSRDGFVAKLTSAGALSWNTFLGGSGDDCCYGITTDASSNVYVVGYCSATWESPIRAFSGSVDDDSFVAKLTSAGVLSWNTFLGGSGDDSGRAITTDATGNVYVVGESSATWGTPIRAYSGSYDGFVAELSSAGILVWNTFLGGSGSDSNYGIVMDASGNVYVAGYGSATWGSPIRAFSGGNRDCFLTKLTSAGALSWNTFFGGNGDDVCTGITMDATGNMYVAGWSDTTWSSPIRTYTSGYDGFVEKIVFSPTVATQAATAVSTTTATLNGSITNFGDTTLATDYGFCYSSTNTTPSTNDILVSLGTTSTTGAYNSSISGLSADTKYYMRVYATNSYGTGYGDTVSFTTAKQLNLKVYLEGLWNGSSMNKCKKWDNALGDLVDLFSGTVVDTVSVELHDPTTYATILYKAHGLELNADGNINTMGKSYIEIPGMYAGSYRVTVKQRNHLETTTASAVSFAGSTVSYDFTDASTKAYLSDASFTPTKQVNSNWMLYAGDVVVTTSYPEIDLDDIYAEFNQNSAKTGVYGYLMSDVNGDGVVDDTDLYIVVANRDKFLYIP
ncbi:MAG: SBBP repeat-containing protein [Paludibacteraceae bacterium]|nr:SBBP repeat-containing protein [Paludibacteraceae bacterium]